MVIGLSLNCQLLHFLCLRISANYPLTQGSVHTTPKNFKTQLYFCRLSVFVWMDNILKWSFQKTMGSRDFTDRVFLRHELKNPVILNPPAQYGSKTFDAFSEWKLRFQHFMMQRNYFTVIREDIKSTKFAIRLISLTAFFKRICVLINWHGFIKRKKYCHRYSNWLSSKNTTLQCVEECFSFFEFIWYE